MRRSAAGCQASPSARRTTSELRIGAGHYYADGTLLENDSETAYPDQPDRFDVDWPLPAGRHAIVLESWRRLITALDDPSIREVALGGPTTSSRERVVWQVGRGARRRRTGSAPTSCPTGCRPPASWPRAPSRTQVLTSPCLVPPQAGFTGLENQFYRVEIFDSGPAYDLDAAPDTVDVTAFPAGNQVTVSALGPLAVGDAVEVFRTTAGPDPLAATFGVRHRGERHDPNALGQRARPDARGGAQAAPGRRGVRGLPGQRIRGDHDRGHRRGRDHRARLRPGRRSRASPSASWSRSATTGSSSTGRAAGCTRSPTSTRPAGSIILRTPAAALDADPTGVHPTRHPKLRRWDGAGAVRFQPDGQGWIHLEAATRSASPTAITGPATTGPSRPARRRSTTASGTIEWPDDSGTPALQFPFGIVRHRCVLGYVDIDGQGRITELEDCRDLFPPLTSMRNLLYVGGDGQEGSPSRRGRGVHPAARPGWPYGWRTAASPSPARPCGSAPVATSASAKASSMAAATQSMSPRTPTDWPPCGGTSTPPTEHQLCVAQLLAPSGDPIPHQVVRFHATIDRDQEASAGCCLSVGPGGDYPTLDEALVDLMVRLNERDICLCLMPGDHLFAGGSQNVDAEKLPMRLAIHGSGRATRLLLESRWELSGWRAVSLRDADVLTNRDAHLAFREVADVELSGLHVYGVRPDGALVSVQDLRRLQVVSCVLVARQPSTFELLRRLLDGLDLLERPWVVPDEVILRPAIEATATELVNLSAADRRELAQRLRERLSVAGDQVSRGELLTLGRLADTLEASPNWSACVHALVSIVRAADMARGRVALEVGPAPSGRLDETAPEVSVLISDNDVVGVLTFYGRGEPHFVLEEQTLKLLDAFLIDNVRLIATGGVVHVHDNRLGRLGLSTEMIALLDRLVQDPQALLFAYTSFHLTDNVIAGAPNEVLAGHVAAVGNDFTLDALDIGQGLQDGLVAHVIADTATYTGNRGGRPFDPVGVLDVTRASAGAANVELQIL